MSLGSFKSQVSITVYSLLKRHHVFHAISKRKPTVLLLRLRFCLTMRATELFSIFVFIKSLERISICPGFTPSFTCSGIVSVPTSLVPSALLNILSPSRLPDNQSSIHTDDTAALVINLSAPVINAPTCKFYISQIARPRLSPVSVIPPRPQPICLNRHLNPTFEVPGPKSPWIIPPPFPPPSESSFPSLKISPFLLPSEKLENKSFWLPLVFTLVLVMSIWNFYRAHSRQSRRCTVHHSASQVASNPASVSSWSQPSALAFEHRKMNSRQRVIQPHVYISTLPSLPAFATLQGNRNVTSEKSPTINTPGPIFAASSPPPYTMTVSPDAIPASVAPSSSNDKDDESAKSSPIVPPTLVIPPSPIPLFRTTTASPVELPASMISSIADDDSTVSSPIVSPTPLPLPLPLPVRRYISPLIDNDRSPSLQPQSSPRILSASPFRRSFDESAASDSELRAPVYTSSSLSNSASSLQLNEERNLASSCWAPTPALALAQSQSSLHAAPSILLDTQRGLSSSCWAPNASTPSPPPLVQKKRVRTRTSEATRVNPMLLTPRTRTSTAPLPVQFKTPPQSSTSSLSRSIRDPKSTDYEESAEYENMPASTVSLPPSELSGSIWVTTSSPPRVTLPTPPPSTKKASGFASLSESIWAPKLSEDVSTSSVTPLPAEKVLSPRDPIWVILRDIPEVVPLVSVSKSLPSPPPSVKKTQGKEPSASLPAIIQTPLQALSLLSESIWAPKPLETSAERLVPATPLSPVEGKVSDPQDSIWDMTPNILEATENIQAQELDTPPSATLKMTSKPLASLSDSIWAPRPLKMNVEDNIDIEPIFTPFFTKENETSGLEASIWATVADVQESLHMPASVLSTPSSSVKETSDEEFIAPSSPITETSSVASASPSESIWVPKPVEESVGDSAIQTPSKPSSSLYQSVWAPGSIEVIVEDVVPIVMPSPVEKVVGLQGSIWATPPDDPEIVEPTPVSATLPDLSPSVKNISDSGMDSPLSPTAKAPSQASSSHSIWDRESMDEIVEIVVAPAASYLSTEDNETSGIEDKPDVPDVIELIPVPATVTLPSIEKESGLQDSIWATMPDVPKVTDPTSAFASFPTPPPSVKKARMKGSDSSLPTSAETLSEARVSLSETTCASKRTEVNSDEVSVAPLSPTVEPKQTDATGNNTISSTATSILSTLPTPPPNVNKIIDRQSVIVFSPTFDISSETSISLSELISAPKPMKVRVKDFAVLTGTHSYIEKVLGLDDSIWATSTPTPAASQGEDTILDLLLACERQHNTVSSSRWALSESPSTPPLSGEFVELSTPPTSEETASDLEALLISCETRNETVDASRWAPKPESIEVVAWLKISCSKEAKAGSSTPLLKEETTGTEPIISPVILVVPSMPVPASVEEETSPDLLDLLLSGFERQNNGVSSSRWASVATPPPCDNNVSGLSDSIWATPQPVSTVAERAPGSVTMPSLPSTEKSSGLGASIWATAPHAALTPERGPRTSEPLELLLACKRRKDTISASRWANAPDITEPSPLSGRKQLTSIAKSQGCGARRVSHKGYGGVAR
ncbi:hypothetical protein J132_08152 [Termitomyces sp. J132]|nr:hypothetical protein J132_08152 [Termitomyces sp. J132]